MATSYVSLLLRGFTRQHNPPKPEPAVNIREKPREEYEFLGFPWGSVEGSRGSGRKTGNLVVFSEDYGVL